MNNEMDDFSAAPGIPNQFGLLGAKANEITPNKRPLSSMTPTIVMKENDLFFTTGSPGGARRNNPGGSNGAVSRPPSVEKT